MGLFSNFLKDGASCRRHRPNLHERQQPDADHQHDKANRRRGGERPLYVIHDATPLPASHVSPMAAPDLAESRLRLWPECCDRVTKLGPVRGQSAASPARVSMPPSGTRKPGRLMSSRPVGQHRASIPNRRPRSPTSGVFCWRAWVSAGLDSIRGLVRLS